MVRERPTSAAEYAAGKLRLAIINGDMAPGARIHQHALADEIGVSHVPLREAVQRLESEGFVAIHPRRGAFVMPVSREDVAEIYDLKLDLETKALSLSVPNLTAADMQAIQDRCREADNSKDVIEYGKLSKQFHLALYSGARRPRLMNLIQGLWANSERYTIMLRHVRAPFDQSQLDHWDIAEAVLARDVDTACTILARHIHAAGLEIDSILAEREQAPAG